jgi:hypothetical protein
MGKPLSTVYADIAFAKGGIPEFSLLDYLG